MSSRRFARARGKNEDRTDAASGVASQASSGSSTETSGDFRDTFTRRPRTCSSRARRAARGCGGEAHRWRTDSSRDAPKTGALMMFPTESRRGSRTRDGRLTHASSGARDAPRAARAVRHACGTSLTGAPNAREWKCRGRECPKRHVLVFWFLGCRDTNRRARPKKARPKRRARHNGTAPAGGSGGERWREPPSRCTSCASRRACRRRTARAATATRRARNRTRPLFRPIPCWGHRARRESIDPPVPRRRVETTRRTPRRASDADACSRLSARASSASEGLRLDRLERLLEARSSSRSSKVRFGPGRVREIPPARRPRRARARVGPKREPGRVREETYLARRHASPGSLSAWRPSRASRRRRGARVERGRRANGTETKTKTKTKEKKPSRRVFVSTPRRRPPSRSTSRACAPCASPSLDLCPAGTRCGSRGA